MTWNPWVHQDTLPSVNQACASNTTGLLPPGSGGLLLDERLLNERGALLHQPQLLVLDEPTNNLDAKSVAALLDILEKLERHATLLVASHDQRILQRAERVFRLEGGLLATAPGVETQCQT